MAGLHGPLPTLRPWPRGPTRTARGRRGSLLLRRIGLSPTTPGRSPGALPSPDEENPLAANPAPPSLEPLRSLRFDRFRSLRLGISASPPPPHAIPHSSLPRPFGAGRPIAPKEG